MANYILYMSVYPDPEAQKINSFKILQATKLKT